MSALPQAPPITSGEFSEITRHWLERAELIDGEIHVLPPPSVLHQAIVLHLIVHLHDWVAGPAGRGMIFTSPIDVVLGEHSRVQPDVCWWALGVDLSKLSAGPPDLAVEVLSPGTRRRDLGEKRLDYERAGVAELWLADPVDASMTLLRRSAPGAGYDLLVRREDVEVVETPLMPGLAVPAASLFPA